MMKRLLFLLAPLFALIVIGWTLSLHRSAALTPAAPTVYSRPPYDPGALAKTIAFYEQRVKSDPGGVIEANLLSGLYSQRCRETGDISDAVRGEKMARHALQIRARNNGAAWDQIAVSLVTQHRFTEALEAVAKALDVNREDKQALDLQIEIYTERGDYPEAEKAIHAREAQGIDIHLMALQARLAEIKGNLPRALELLKKAQETADKNYDLPNENVAWFHMRVGDMLAAMGRADEAEKSYAEALELFPREYKTLTALARLECGRGNWAQAEQWGRKAADVVPTPEVIALLGDALWAQKKSRDAQDQYGLIEAMGTLSRAQGTIYDRQRALYLADHDRNLEEALSLARRELTGRHDVYAYDTLAWVCCKKGLLEEAQTAMQKALAQNTQDSRLLYHAGILAEKRGDHMQAKVYLSRALALNPYFLPFAPDEARKLVAR